MWRSATRSNPGPRLSQRTTGEAHVIVNNAGVALGATLDTVSYEDFEWLMNIDFWGVVYGTRSFLPHLKAAGFGHVVNISSVFGIVSVPTQGVYIRSQVCGARIHRSVA